MDELGHKKASRGEQAYAVCLLFTIFLRITTNLKYKPKIFTKMLAKLLEYVLYYYSGQEIYGLPAGLRERKF
ncbi:hypothetical protein [Paenibacillus chibensis]|uniref:hypothetical protein n=1 Tax=Paenibacillus chibensis TaxID=59846 RepID=UPI0013E342AA|nr:hypothetical protein [Paenibacillus chibensis]